MLNPRLSSIIQGVAATFTEAGRVIRVVVPAEAL